MIDTIVFDFDGTLAELRLDFGAMKRRIAALAEFYLSRPPAPSSLPALEWLSQLGDRMTPAAASEFKGKAHQVILQMELEAAAQGRLFTFTRRLLRDLAARRIKTAIITRNCTQAVESVFPDRRRYCPCLLTRDHVRRVKPDPSHLLTALERLHSRPEHALMVGDHPLDIETGRSAGTYAAAVTSGNTDWATLARYHPDWIAADCDRLVHVLGINQKLRSLANEQEQAPL